jgi:hypothetical protein
MLEGQEAWRLKDIIDFNPLSSQLYSFPACKLGSWDAGMLEGLEALKLGTNAGKLEGQEALKLKGCNRF